MGANLNHGGVWPAVAANDDGGAKVTHLDFAAGKRLSPIDLSEGMPERQDSIAPETLAVIIIATGLVVVIVGWSILVGPLWVKFLLAVLIGVVTRWAFDKVK